MPSKARVLHELLCQTLQRKLNKSAAEGAAKVLVCEIFVLGTLPLFIIQSTGSFTSAIDVSLILFFLP